MKARYRVRKIDADEPIMPDDPDRPERVVVEQLSEGRQGRTLTSPPEFTCLRDLLDVLEWAERLFEEEDAREFVVEVGRDR